MAILSLSINDVTAANENAANATFTVTLSAATGLDVTVDYTTSDGTATAGADYTATSGTLTIPAGSTSTTFTVGVLYDILDEANETVTLTISNPTNATISDATGTLTITDDDPTPSIAFNMHEDGDDSNLSSSGSGSSKALIVYLSAAAGREVTVDYAVTGTATAGTDFTLANGTLTIPAGYTSGTILITNINSALVNEGKTIIVTLSSPSNASLGDDEVHTYTLEEAIPNIGFDDVNYQPMVSESVSSKEIPVYLSAATGSDVTAAYAVTGTATGSGTDFTLANGILTIPAGETTGTITIADIIDDNIDEANETIIVTLEDNPTNALLGDGDVYIYTIIDNDATPSLSINDITVLNGTYATFTVTLSAASGRDVTVNYANF